MNFFLRSVWWISMNIIFLRWMECLQPVSRDLITHLKVLSVLEGSPNIHRSFFLMVAIHWKASRRQSPYLKISLVWNFGLDDHWLETSSPPPFIGASWSHKPRMTYFLMIMMMMIIEYSNNLNFQLVSVCYT